ncbi:DUF1561 family protein [Helicobacter cetorum]|uniref:Uncharacterized protein n=1 Tax=Helicobacter cetorum (strain ATCC BAA-429 / MIT 00-7128) TaxID=182217 RepID=I0EKV8_HELC0|nr:DUF1561 family protein [Helicobacter cetorum]AFI03577.1 hypothetical protein HCW_01460 [Helicobacter cetorum MIT 00-7128]
MADSAKNIEIVLDDKTYGLHLVFYKGESYPVLGDVKSSIKASIDSLGRIIFVHHGVHLALTAPDSVTGLYFESTEKWDYLTFRPAVLNDDNQRFIIRDKKILTANQEYIVKVYKNTLYISKNPTDYYDFHLSDTTSHFLSHPSEVFNFSFKTPISWLYLEKGVVYYVESKRSVLDFITYYYYNPITGHIAQYHKDTGELYGLTSSSGIDSWEYIHFKPCKDEMTAKEKENNKNQSFQLLLVDNKAIILDAYGNNLRVKTYGPYWGVPYFINPSYANQDDANTPIDYFYLDNAIGDLSRFTHKSLETCSKGAPQAPILDPKLAHRKSSRELLGLGNDFQLTDAWKRRLHAIATTCVRGVVSRIGMCGVCLLQSYQIVLELLRYTDNPLQSGGALFDTAPNTDPFISFTSRFPGLALALEIPGEFIRRVSDPAYMPTRAAHAHTGMSYTMLAGYQVSTTPMLDSTQFPTRLNEMLHAEAGNVWIAFVYSIDSSGRTNQMVGHALPFVRTRDGLIAIRTNTPDRTLENYSHDLFPLRDLRAILNVLTTGFNHTIRYVQLVHVDHPIANPFSQTLTCHSFAHASQ